MSNHFSGPDFTFPHGDARLDISDMYVFPKPGDAGKSILVMDVHPSIGFNPPGPTPANGFADEAVYEFKIDTDADAVANIVYRVRFSPLTNGSQTATVERAEGPTVASTKGGETIFAEVPVSDGTEIRVAEAGEYRFFAGPRSDPFFADVAGALNGLQFTGSDTMADVDVNAIVIQVPNAALGARSQIGVWATVRIPSPNQNGGTGWLQVERAGRPEAVNLYCQGEDKTAFNAGEPAQDRAAFLDKFAHALEHMGNYPPDAAKSVAETMLPDILPYNYARPAAFPHSGRALTDDAWDHALSVYTRREISDGVGPHTDLLTDFPYLAPPHQAQAVATAPQLDQRTAPVR